MGHHPHKIISVSSSLKQDARKYRHFVKDAKITPWIDHVELEQTGRSLLHAIHLFSPPPPATTNSPISLDPSSMVNLRHAIRRVAVWRCRCPHGHIPHIIDTSAALAETLLQDHTNTITTNTQTSTMQIRLSYSTTLIRGINGLADDAAASQLLSSSSRQERQQKSSVASLLSYPTFNVPRWIVDIRHGASHTGLPSLVCLRMAAVTLLGYLGEKYWRNGVGRLSWGEGMARGLLQSYEEASSNNKREQLLLEPLEYAKEFVEVVPMGIGLRMVLDYLVRGCCWGHTDAASSAINSLSLSSTVQQRGGALVPCIFYSANKEGFAAIKAKYHALLLMIQGTWKGFTSALIVEIVDYILRIESNNIEQQHHEHSSSRRDLYYYSEWVRYLLSRDWQSHFCHDEDNNNVSCFKKVNLREKPPTLWTKDEVHFMTSPAPRLVLESMEIPLYGLRDRCYSTVSVSTSSKREEGVVGSHMLCGILTNILQEKTATRVMSLSMDVANEKHTTIDIAEKECHIVNKCDDTVTMNTSNEIMTLEDMEQLLNDDDNVEEQKYIDTEETDNNSKQNNDHNVVIKQASEKKKRGWMLCDYWDACPIGTLPGYPMKRRRM